MYKLQFFTFIQCKNQCDGSTWACEREKYIICNVKFGDSGAIRDWGKNYLSKVPYMESPTLICLFTMQLLWATMMTKCSLLLSAPIVKRFRSKKTNSRFWSKFEDFADKYGFKIKFQFYCTKKAHSCAISRLLNYRA